MNTHQQTAAQEAQAELQAEWERESETNTAPSETPSVSIWRITNSGDVVPFDASDIEDEYDETTPPREQEIEVVVYRPNEWPRVRKIENTLAALQQLVGGRIEVFPVGVCGAIGICNEEFIAEGLPPNRYIPATGGVIAGNFLVVGDGVDFTSLSKRQIVETLLRI